MYLKKGAQLNVTVHSQQIVLQDLYDDNTSESGGVNKECIESEMCEAINQTLSCNQVEGNLAEGLYMNNINMNLLNHPFSYFSGTVTIKWFTFYNMNMGN